MREKHTFYIFGKKKIQSSSCYFLWLLLPLIIYFWLLTLIYGQIKYRFFFSLSSPQHMGQGQLLLKIEVSHSLFFGSNLRLSERKLFKASKINGGRRNHDFVISSCRICLDVSVTVLTFQIAPLERGEWEDDGVRRPKTGEVLLLPAPARSDLQIRIQRADSHPDIWQGGQVHLPGHGEWLGRHDLPVPVRGIFSGNNSLSPFLCRQLLVKTWQQFELKIKIKMSGDFSYFWFSVISLPFPTG